MGDMISEMSASTEFKNPVAWRDVVVDTHDGLLVLGGFGVGWEPVVPPTIEGRRGRHEPGASVALTGTATDPQNNK